MLKSLLLLVLLLCIRSVFGDHRDPTILDWPSWLLVDPEAPRHVYEEEEPPKTRRITPKSVFIAPAFSGSSPLPDCAEGYKADSMGRCVKLVQLNHAAQLNFLLQRLNAMYSTRPVEKDTNHSDTSSDSDGPLHFTIPLDISPEPEEETKESVEVAVVMADVLKDDRKKPNEEKTQTIVAVWKTGKNGTELEELETASDLEMEAANIRVEKSNVTAPVPDAIKYDVMNEKSNSTIPDKRTSTLDSGKSSSDSPIAIISSEDDSEAVEPSKVLDSAMDLFEEVSEVISEDGRIGNTSRRNVSLDVAVKDSNSTEEVNPPIPEKSVVKKVLTQPEEMKSSGSDPEAEVQESIETVRKVEVHKIIETVNEPPSVENRPSSYVRFPDENYERYVGGGDSSGGGTYNSMAKDYVHFPNTDTYYEGLNDQPLFTTDVQQKPSFWWLPPGWRLDPRRHQPMLVRFWARMPLLRDPMYQNDNVGIRSYQHMGAYRRRGPLVY